MNFLLLFTTGVMAFENDNVSFSVLKILKPVTIHIIKLPNAFTLCNSF